MADKQRAQWERSYIEDPEMFGEQPSLPAMYAARIFQNEGKTDILELGPGQGRDTLYFLQQGLNVWALDYAKPGLRKIEELAKEMKAKPKSGSLTTIRHDLRFSAIRETDLLGRFGGEEFAILLLEMGAVEAVVVAERLRQSIYENHFINDDGTRIPLRVSVGMAQHQTATESLAELMLRADNALYRAKREGRNKVVEAD
jgi:hypothetical protein